MDSSPGKMCEHALVAVDDALYGIIICEHREDGIAFTGLGEVFSRFGAQCDQRLRPFRRSVIDCDSVTGLDEVGCHPAAHVSEANEANVHVSLLLLPSILAGYGRVNSSQQHADISRRYLTLADTQGNAAQILQVRVDGAARVFTPFRRAFPRPPLSPLPSTQGIWSVTAPVI